MYCENLPLSRDLDPQENMHGEELLSIASSVLVLVIFSVALFYYLYIALIFLISVFFCSTITRHSLG